MRVWDSWVVPLSIVTLMYFVAFYLSFLVIFPFQNSIFGTIPLNASLLFLPHGVRVLAAYFYGWKSAVFLAPASIQTHYYLFGWEGFTPLILVAVLISVMCASMSFSIFKIRKIDFRVVEENGLSWRNLLLVGVVASVINALSTSMYDSTLSSIDLLRTVLAYLIGDISGQFFMMFLLMLCFRWARS